MESNAATTLDDDPLRNDARFWGDYNALYITLEMPEVASLEKAVKARKLGRLREAFNILTKQLPPFHILPVLALERAKLEEQIGVEIGRYLVLETALKSQSEWRMEPIGREIDLLNMLAAQAKYRAYGDLQEGLDRARSLSRAFKAVPLEQWSFAEFGEVVAYYEIISDGFHLSNWVDIGKDLDLLPVKPTSSSTVAEVIGNHLVEAQEFTLALNLLRAEAYMLSGGEILRRLSALVKICETESQVSRLPGKALLQLLSCRIYFAEILFYLDEFAQADEQLSKARSELDASRWILPKDGPSLSLRRMEIYVESENLPARITDLNILAPHSQLNGDRLEEAEILGMVKARLKRVAAPDRSRTWSADLDWVDERLNELNFHRKRTAGSACRRLIELGSDLHENPITNAADLLRRLQKFEAANPNFNIPLRQMILYAYAKTAADLLGKTQEAITFEVKHKSAALNTHEKTLVSYNINRNKPFSEWGIPLMEVIISWLMIDLRNQSPLAKKVLYLLSPSEADHSGPSPDEDYESAITRLLGYSSEELLHKLFGHPLPVDSEEWGHRFSCLEKWLWDFPVEIRRPVRHSILADLQYVRMNFVNGRYADVANDPSNLADEDLQFDVRMSKCQENRRLRHLKLRIHHDAKGSQYSRTGRWLPRYEKFEALIELSKSVKAVKTRRVTDEELLAGQNWLETELSKLPEIQVDLRMKSSKSIGLLLRMRYLCFGAVPADAQLNAYERFHELYIQKRLSASIMGGCKSMNACTQFESTWYYVDHHDFAVVACVEAIFGGWKRTLRERCIQQNVNFEPFIPEPQRSRSELFIQLSNWVQATKARFVVRVLGAEVIVPLSIMAGANNDRRALKLFQKESDLDAALKRSNREPIEVSESLDKVRQKIRRQPNLEQLMNFRDGASLTSHKIRDFGRSLGPHVLIVDFVFIQYAVSGMTSEILPMIYKEGLLVSHNFVNAAISALAAAEARPSAGINPIDVRGWISSMVDEAGSGQNRTTLATENAEAALQRLFPLIEDAVKLSKPGDTIVLCPSDVLFGIPLHAILLENGQPLIARNPIVYTQSLSTLHFCHVSTSASNSDEALNPLAVKALSPLWLYPNNPGPTTMTFARRINAKVLQETELTNPSFLAACADSKLIHFYGHMAYNSKVPLSTHLVIHDLDEEAVDLRDLLNLQLRPGSHVSLIDCSRDGSQAGPNYSLLCLSTALMYAGASSVLGCLWPVEIEDASEFQERFYIALLNRSASVGGERPRFLNLAKALQRAVLRVREGSGNTVRAPYHWASFMLYGCWNRFPAFDLRSKHDRSAPTPAIGKRKWDSVQS